MSFIPRARAFTVTGLAEALRTLPNAKTACSLSKTCMFHSHLFSFSFNKLCSRSSFPGPVWICSRLSQRNVMSPFPDLPTNYLFIECWSWKNQTHRLVQQSKNHNIAETVIAVASREPWEKVYSPTKVPLCPDVTSLFGVEDKIWGTALGTMLILGKSSWQQENSLGLKIQSGRIYSHDRELSWGSCVSWKSSRSSVQMRLNFFNSFPQLSWL